MEIKKLCIDRYTQLEPQGGNQFTPRVGKYSILEIVENTIDKRFPLAKALWSENEDEDFGDEIRTINLLPIRLGIDPNQHFEPLSLVGNPIIITRQSQVSYVYKGEEYDTIKCRWYFLPIYRTKSEADSFLNMPGNTKLTDINWGPDDDQDTDPWCDYADID